MTRSEYDNRLAENARKVADTENRLAALSEIFDAGLYISTPENDAAWNTLHDRLRDLRLDREQIERDWNRRNWTAADYNSWELVCNNVD